MIGQQADTFCRRGPLPPRLDGVLTWCLLGEFDVFDAPVAERDQKPLTSRMPENYHDAALRHFKDSERLAGEQRFDNAGHLIGFAAECALKHHFGITALQSTPKTHLPDLAAAMRKRFSARDPNQAAMYSLLTIIGPGYFAGWSVNDRYGQDGTISEARYNRWREQARRTFGAARLQLAEAA